MVISVVLMACIGVVRTFFSFGLAKVILPAGLALTIYAWLIARAKRGLSYRQLPAQTRNRLLKWSIAAGAAYFAATVGSALIYFSVAASNGSWDRGFRTRQLESTEWLFVPSAREYEKLGLRVNLSSAKSQSDCSVVLAIHRNGESPATMMIGLPGLRAAFRIPQNNSFERSSILDKDTLAEWLSKGAGIDPAQEEVNEVYALLKQYENEPPQTVMEFVNLAKAELRHFSFGGMQGNAFSYGGVSLVPVAAMAIVLGLVYLGVQYWLERRVYRGLQVQSSSGASELQH
jgi:hypothetical protein